MGDRGHEHRRQHAAAQECSGRRRSNGSDAFDPASEWDGFATDTFDGLGAYSGGGADGAPNVSTTSPSPSATGVEPDASITVNFSEPVTLAAEGATISCATSGAHTATMSGGPTSHTLDPDSDFAGGETCTVAIAADAVSDADTQDPPDTMARDFTWSFETVRPPLTIGEVQGETRDDEDGATNASPFAGQTVTVQGVITQNLLQSDGNHAFFVQSMPATSDGDSLSSDGLFVFIGRFSSLRKDGGGFYTPTVGDESSCAARCRSSSTRPSSRIRSWSGSFRREASS